MPILSLAISIFQKSRDGANKHALLHVNVVQKCRHHGKEPLACRRADQQHLASCRKADLLYLTVLLAAVGINHHKTGQISQKIAEINATILKLNELRSKGYLAAEIHQSQVRELQKQLGELKDERQDEFESRILGMLQDVKKLKALIDEIEEPLDEFDEKLFEEIVVEMSLSNQDELTITVLGELKFTELI